MALETGTAQKAAAAATAKARRRAALVADDNKPLPKRTRRLQAKRSEGPPLSSPHYMLVSAAIPDSSIAWEDGMSAVDASRLSMELGDDVFRPSRFLERFNPQSNVSASALRDERIRSGTFGKREVRRW